jgi:hypothetical protein
MYSRPSRWNCSPLLGHRASYCLVHESIANLSSVYRFFSLSCPELLVLRDSTSVMSYHTADDGISIDFFDRPQAYLLYFWNESERCCWQHAMANRELERRRSSGTLQGPYSNPPIFWFPCVSYDSSNLHPSLNMRCFEESRYWLVDLVPISPRRRPKEPPQGRPQCIAQRDRTQCQPTKGIYLSCTN